MCRPTCCYMGTSSLRSEQGVQLIDTSNHFNKKKKKRWLLCTVHKKNSNKIKERFTNQSFVLFPVQVHPRRSPLYSRLLNTSWKHSCTAFIETTHEGTTNHDLTLHHHHHLHLHYYCPWSQTSRDPSGLWTHTSVRFPCVHNHFQFHMFAPWKVLELCLKNGFQQVEIN